jgi:hypothetical protein
MGVFLCLPSISTSRFELPKQFVATAAVAAVCLLVGAFNARAQLVINELYYDHPGSDGGYEFVEIMNVSSGGVPLAGVSLEFHNGAGDGWETIWNGASGTIAPGGLFAVGGRYVLPPPGAVAELGLQNGPDAVRLTVGGVPADVVGYGGMDDGEYVEHASAPRVAAGRSLARLPDGADSDDNSADFTEAIPSPGSFNLPRRDAAISASGATAAAAVLSDDGHEVLAFRLANEGLYDIPAGEVTGEVWDSSGTTRSLLDRFASTGVVAPGDAVVVSVPATLPAGYHLVIAEIDYEADERPHNNRVLLLRRVGGPALLVSEVLCYPEDGCPQFVELFNAGVEVLDIAGFLLRDRSHPPTAITEDERLVPPGAYVAVTPDAGALFRWFPSVPEDRVVQHTGTWPVLNRSGSGGVSDSVVVTDQLALPIDAVGYPPVDSDYRGRSLERVDLYAGGSSQTWVLSRHPSGATPGRANERSLLAPPMTGEFEVTPRTFSPFEGETLTAAFDTGEAVAAGARAVVSVYDVEGRRLVEVGSATSFPAVFVWNGRVDDGRAVPPGLYLVVCEVFSPSGVPTGVSKVVVGCGRRNP